MMHFDRKIFFDAVRVDPFGGSLTQQQVDGMEFKLGVWEADYAVRTDLRWLAYPLATSWWETAQTMWPIEEYGKGKGQPYGVVDPETGQTYYGRGDVQLTWRDNYRRASQELMLFDDDNLEWHAERALDPEIAAAVLFEGMIEGWFRSSGAGPCSLGRYFSDTVDDPFNARDIINGDKTKLVNGVRIGDLIATTHRDFLTALVTSARDLPPAPVRRFAEGDRVQKISGSSWHGRVCGTYSTSLTPEGYCVESEREPGSVQNYPVAALEAAP